MPKVQTSSTKASENKELTISMDKLEPLYHTSNDKCHNGN